MSVPAAVLNALAQDNIGTIAYLIDFEFDSGTLRFTTIPNGTTFDGESYTFLGGIGSVGTVEETDELEPAQYDILIGSADPTILSTFLNDPALNRRCVCHQAILNDDQSFVGEPWIYFRGSMQPPSINDGKEPRIQILVKDELADWDRNITSNYTDAEQRRLFPGDFSLENISQLAGRKIIWPDKEGQGITISDVNEASAGLFG